MSTRIAVFLQSIDQRHVLGLLGIDDGSPLVTVVVLPQLSNEGINPYDVANQIYHVLQELHNKFHKTVEEVILVVRRDRIEIDRLASLVERSIPGVSCKICINQTTYPISFFIPREFQKALGLTQGGERYSWGIVDPEAGLHFSGIKRVYKEMRI